MRLVLAFLLICGPALAQDLKLSAWNLSWLTLRTEGLPEGVLPKRADDIARLRAYALQLDSDVIAFSEVDGPELAAQVFPPERYRIHITQDSVVQRAGFAIRTSIRFTANPDLTALDLYAHAKFHLRSAADITLNLPGGPLRLLAVHLKSGCRSGTLGDPRDPACRTLGGQLPHLQTWIAARAAEGTAFVMLGDFNRWMEPPDRFFAALVATAPLTRADQGQHSPCWGGAGFLDHIIAGGQARVWMQPETLRVLVYRETTAMWKERLSDHCPVSVKFHLPPD